MGSGTTRNICLLLKFVSKLRLKEQVQFNNVFKCICEVLLEGVFIPTFLPFCWTVPLRCMPCPQNLDAPENQLSKSRLIPKPDTKRYSVMYSWAVE